MKNRLIRVAFLFFSCIPAVVYGQSYQAELSKLNTFLKTFDNGYYGYMEVKEGYLYDRFKSGEHTKTAINKLGKASVTETNRKVQLFCRNNENCVFSTYTDSYHSAMSFSQSSDFNTSVLIGLLDNLVAALQGNNTAVTTNTTSSQSTASAARLEREKHTTQPQPQPSSTTTTTTTTAPVSSGAAYSAQLNALNSYLQVFNPDTYGEVSVKGGKVFFEFKFYTQRYYSSIPIAVLTQKTSIVKGGTLGQEEIKIQCLGEADCFYSSYNEENTDHFRFFSYSVKDLGKMQRLLEDFVNALK